MNYESEKFLDGLMPVLLATTKNPRYDSIMSNIRKRQQGGCRQCKKEISNGEPFVGRRSRPTHFYCNRCAKLLKIVSGSAGIRDIGCSRGALRCLFCRNSGIIPAGRKSLTCGNIWQYLPLNTVVYGVTKNKICATLARES